jgi:hypothetical protein
MSPVAAPGIYARTAEGKILFAMPLKPVPAPGCTHWNTCIAQRRKG